MDETEYTPSIEASVFRSVGLITGLLGIHVGGTLGTEHPDALAVNRGISPVVMSSKPVPRPPAPDPIRCPGPSLQKPPC